MTADSIAIERGWDFAVLAVNAFRAGTAPAPLLRFDGNLAVTSRIPTAIIEGWKTGIGTFHARELEATELFLWALRPAGGEHQQPLSQAVNRFYLGLLIAVPFSGSGRLTAIDGSSADGSIHAHSLRQYSRTHWLLGSPMPRFTSGHLRSAARFASAIGAQDESASAPRLARALRAFRSGVESAEVAYRLHQFVRTVEAIANPHSAKQFVDRASRVCKGLARPYLASMYKIRNKIEHQHGPFAAMPARLSERERQLRLMHACLHAEALARYFLHAYLLSPSAWPFLASSGSVDGFWALETRRFRRLWKSRLSFDSIRDALKESDVPPLPKGSLRSS